MRGKRLVMFVGLVLAMLFIAAACGGGKEETTTGKKGGIIRAQSDGFVWNAGMDPTGEYLGDGLGIMDNLMHRPLIGYRHKPSDQGGNELVPDLATDLGKISKDQLTYDFTIRQGVKFSPPLNREVTTADIKYAFKRVADLTFSASGYPAYYVPNILGMQEYQCGLKSAPKEACRGVTPAKDIAGIETPSKYRIIFRLTHKVGNFRFNLSLPAAAPIPQEIATCATKANEYGRFQISSGPYMLLGIDKLDPSSCASLKKGAVGFEPTTRFRLRRNPNYDPKTDVNKLRANLIDGLDITLNTNTDDIFRRIEQNLADIDFAVREPATVLQRLGNTKHINVNPGDRTWYIFFNLTKPPFDDLHVRRAANYVMDKSALVRARGGKFAGLVAEHIVPPDTLGDLEPGEFDPYASPGHKGDVEKAKAEMKLSKYDKNKDGLCDAAVCKAVLHMTRNVPPYTDMTPVEEDSMKKIGITLVTRPQADFYSAVQVPTATPPIGSGAGWGKDYSDASTFFVPLLSSNVIAKGATQNFSYLGLTPGLAREIGIKFPSGGVPSADPDIARCIPRLIGEDRTACWVALDKKMMTDQVPWIPYNWATTVFTTGDAVNYVYDAQWTTPAWSRMSVDPSKQKKG